MNQKAFLILSIIFLFSLFLCSKMGFTQNCKELNNEVYNNWMDVSKPVISNDGNFIVFELKPQKGDGNLIIFDLRKQTYDTLPRAHSAVFLPNDPILIYRIAPPFDSLRKQKLAGFKSENLLKDSLEIRWLELDSCISFPAVKKIDWSKKNGSVIAWLHDESYKPPIDTLVADSTLLKKKPSVNKSKKAPKTHYLGALNALTGATLQAKNVLDLLVSQENERLLISKLHGNQQDSSFVYAFGTALDDSLLVFNKNGIVSQLSMDEKGNQFVFLHSSDTASRKLFNFYFYSKESGGLTLVADSTHPEFKSLYVPGEHFQPRFSKDGEALYFGIARKPEPLFKDSLTTDEKVSLDLWHWKDGQLQTQQLKNKEKELKRTFLSVFYPKSGKIFRLASEEIPEIRPDYDNHPEYFIGYNPQPYEILSSWEQARYQDVYLIDRKSGSAKLLLEKHASIASISPAATSFVFFSLADSNWYALNLKSGLKIALTIKNQDIFYRSESDIPRPAGPIGLAGWRNENEVVVYSQNNIWVLNTKNPVKSYDLMEKNTDLEFRYLKLDEDAAYLPDQVFFSTFNTKIKSSGFASYDFKYQQYADLIHGDFLLKGLRKAKDADVFLYQKEDFTHYPDLYLTKDFSKQSVQLSFANPQQNEYCWGSVHLVEWTAFNGAQLQGLLYRPANYSADSSYPMLVYFYERSSNGLHRHITPRPSRSVINISEYTNRGYFVFVPDIIYSTGFPGQSAYDAIVSGTQCMLERNPQIDKTRLGLQGQSWGGYQTAWLITRTNLFAAAMAGAPVSNMTSAYGGIRWESGVVRAFQYEQGQSRIGASLWEDLPKYLENSPIFYADRIQTPLLIMANDADGAVPWYQGIELFNALRRLQKPVWMINYNNAPHNLSRRADMEDLTVRMRQFFDHYLMGNPAPKWLLTGIPAVEKGKTYGFDF